MPSPELFTSIKPLLFISRLCGFFLFSIDPKTSGAVVSTRDLISIVLSILINVTIQVSFWLSNHSAGVHSLAMMKFTLPILMYLNHLFIIFAAIWIFIKRSELLTFLSGLAEVDAQLAVIGSDINHKRNGKVVAVLASGVVLSVVSATTFCGLIHGFHGVDIEIMLQAFNLWIIICTLVIYLHMVFAIAAISQRFAALFRTFELLDPGRLAQLSRVCEVHLRLADLIRHFNAIYAPVMVLYFANGFGWICLAVFGISMFARYDIVHFCTMMCMVLHSIVTIVSSSVFARTAEDLQAKKELLRRCSYGKVCQFGESFEFCVKLSQLQAQINDIGLEVSCGFFEINWRFVFRFFSAGIMYFIIMVQFENSMAK